VGLFEEAFERLVTAGYQVLCLTVTGQHSGTFGSASTAAKRFGGMVVVLDSLSLSLGEGFQVLAAARAALAGKAMAQVARAAEEVRRRTRLFILLDSIEHIRRGGRADALIPLLHRVTGVLRIKPILNLEEGHLGLHALVRSYERGLRRITADVAGSGPLAQLAVIHTRAAAIAERVADVLSERLAFPREEIVVDETGPVLSVHAGSGVLGVAGVRRDG
jgi:DegV family protein with EDD domain